MDTRRYLFAFLAGCSILPVQAEVLSLHSAWQKAVASEPAWRMARAEADIDREESNKARAGLLPQIGYSMSESKNRVAYASGTTSSYASGTSALTLRQPLFRMQSFSEFQRAGVRGEIAEFRLGLEEQNLAVRVSQAYFDALLAEDAVRLTQFHEQTLATQLDAAQKAFRSGSGTRTEIDEARARVAVAGADRVAAENGVANARKRLSAIVGVPVTQVLPLDGPRAEELRLSPASFSEWLALAKQNNPDLAAATKAVEETSHAVTTARSGHLPTLDLVASKSRAQSDTVSTINNRYDTNSVGLQLNIPLFSGGFTTAETAQAQARHQRALAARENSGRQLETRLLQEFNGVFQGRERLASLAVAADSAREAVISTTRGVQAGTRTTLDVLNAERQSYQTVLDRARARYDWIMSRMRLQALAGKLGETEIREINALLSMTACGTDCPPEMKATSSAAAGNPVAKVSIQMVPALADERAQENKPEPKPEPGPEARSESQQESKPDVPPPPVPAAEPAPATPAVAEAKPMEPVDEVPSPAPAMKTATSSEPKLRNEPRSNGKFAVQLGVFGNPENVTKLLAATDKLNVPAYTEPFNDKLMRVRAGPYATRAEALKALALLKEAGIAGVLTRR